MCIDLFLVSALWRLFSAVSNAWNRPVLAVLRLANGKRARYQPALGLKVEEASAVREWSLQTEHFTECDPRAKLWTRCPRCRRERRARVCQAEVAHTARTCTTSPCRSACPDPTSSTRTDSASTGANWNSWSEVCSQQLKLSQIT